jgi:hypothetical protein
VATQLWKIELFAESDGPMRVDRLADDVARLACADDEGADHVCRVPWFIITSRLDEDDAAILARRAESLSRRSRTLPDP